MTTINLPYNFNPRDYQLNLLSKLDSGVNRAIIVWNRRSGKDKVCFNYMIRRAVEKVGTYYYFLPTYNQAKKVIWDNIDNDGFKMLDHIPKELLKGTNSTELKIELVNGSIIQLIAANEFKSSGVGANPIGVVFSEYSVTDPEALKYVSPILAVNGGWMVFNFTPRGMNHAWTLLQQAKENEKWFTEVLTIDDTKVMSEEALNEERRNNPQDLIDQEYYCKFIEGAGQFFKRVKNNVYDAQDEKPDPLRKYKIGIDLGKYQDFTVITVIDLMTFKVHKQERFNQLDWNTQEAKIEAIYRRYYGPITTMDSTGLGDPIYDSLVKKGIKNLVSFKFTEQSRKDLLNNLAIKIESGKISLPDDEELHAELLSMQYQLTENGKLKIMCPEGLHDDRVMSLALAVWELPDNPLPKPGSVRFMNKTYDNNVETNQYE